MAKLNYFHASVISCVQVLLLWNKSTKYCSVKKKRSTGSREMKKLC